MEPPLSLGHRYHKLLPLVLAASEAGWCCTRKTGHDLTFGGSKDLLTTDQLKEQHCMSSFIDIVCHEKNNWVCTVKVHKLTHAYARERMLQSVFSVQHWQSHVMCSTSCEAAEITERRKVAETSVLRLYLKAIPLADALEYSKQHFALDNSPCLLR